MVRAPCCEKVGLKKGRWTTEEDEALRKYIEANGEGSWRTLPKNAGLLRCGKSCRLRWLNYLRANLKRGNISTEEEEIIVKLHASLGNRWSSIAGQLPGRTDNEVKNYWNSHLSKKLYSFERLDNDRPLIIVDKTKVGLATKHRRGRTSRSAMKNNKSSSRKDVNLSKRRPKSSSGKEKIPNPPTHALEKEPLPCAIDDGNVVLYTCGQDEKPMDAVVSSPCQESGDGLLGTNEEKETIGLCPGQEGKNVESTLFPTGRKENEILEPYNICFDGEMCFDDIMDIEFQDPHGVLTFNDFKQDGDRALSPGNTVRGEDPEGFGNLGSIGGINDFQSSSSMSSCFNSCEANWSWEGIVPTWHELLGDTGEYALRWLWETDSEGESQRIEGSNNHYEKQNDKVARLPS